MILLVAALMAFSFVAGVAATTWRLRRFWRQLKAQEVFLCTRDKQVAKSERRLHDENERYANILGIEGTVVVISHDVMVYQGSMPLLTQGGEMYQYAGPARRQHRLVLEEIITAPAVNETASVEPESQREPEEDDWNPDDYYEETDGDED